MENTALEWKSFTNFQFNRFDANSGLAENSVFDVVEDKFGYIWVSNQGGVSRFVNGEFESFSSIDDNDSSIFNVFNKLQLDEDSLVCLTSLKGYCRFDYSSNRFYQIPVAPEIDKIRPDVLSESISVLDQSYWYQNEHDSVFNIASKDDQTEHQIKGSVQRSFKAGDTYFVHSKTNDSSFLYRHINNELELHSSYLDIIRCKGDDQGRLIVLTSQGIYVDDDLKVAFGLNNSGVRTLFLEPINQGKWLAVVNDEIGTAHLEIDLQYKRVDTLYRGKSSRTLDIAIAVTGDRYFFGVEKKNGEVCLYSSDFSSYSMISHNIPLKRADYLICIRMDSRNNLWVGTWGGGLYQISNDLPVVERLELGLDESSVVPFFANDSVCYAITENSVIKVNLPTGCSKVLHSYPESNEPTFFKTIRNDVYLCRGTSLITKFSLEHESCSFIDIAKLLHSPEPILASVIEQDSSGDLWVGSKNRNSKNSIVRLQLKGGRFRALLYNSISRDSDEFLQEGFQAKVGFFDRRVMSLFADGDDVYMTNQGKGLFKFDQDQNNFTCVEKEMNFRGKRQITRLGEEVWFSTFFSGMLQYDLETNEVINEVSLKKGKLDFNWVDNELVLSEDLMLIKGEKKLWHIFAPRKKRGTPFPDYHWDEFLLLAPHVPRLNDNEFLVPGKGGLNIIRPQLEVNAPENNLVIQKVNSTLAIGADKFFENLSSIETTYDKNDFKFKINDLKPEKQDLVYEYTLEGRDDFWMEFTTKQAIILRDINPGKYFLKYRSKSTTGMPSVLRQLEITVHKPWWLHGYAITAYLLVVVLLFWIILRARTSALKSRQELLESEVEKATQEIKNQKDEIEEAHQEIKDSISYAKRIQSAILPPDKLVKQYLQESFILYKPKDIVAGDFYWVEAQDDTIFFAAADCTGHGVPGAMVSVICNNGLNRSVREFALGIPGEILDKTRELVIQEFAKSEEEVKDGMDIALCALKGNNLYYAGANNPLWIVRDGQVIETKADKQPIGKYAEAKPFTTHQIELQKGDIIYVFSDGYVDQFGGEKGKKFKAKNFRELLVSVSFESMKSQKEKIDYTFENWRGELEQIDDVCVIGVRV